MTTHIETTSEKYARLRRESFETFLENSFSDESLNGVDLYEVTTASGMAFKCRQLDQAFMANSGQMPMALTEQILTADKKPDSKETEENFTKLSPAEKRAAIAATAQMVRYICVEPRLILGDVGNRDNCLSVDEITMDDFRVLAEWAQNGGGAALGPKTFRRTRKPRKR